MRDWRLRPLPVVLFGLTLVLELAAVALSWGLEPAYDTLLYAVYTVTMTGAGTVIASRHPRNPIGWLFCGFGLLNALAADAAQGLSLRAAAEGWPGTDVAAVVAVTSWPPSGLGWIATFLLFPDGRLPGPRWRIVLWVGAVGAALTAPGWLTGTGHDADFPSGRNPVEVAGPAPAAAFVVGVTLLFGALLASVGALVLRFRRSVGVERQQLKWFALAAAVAGLVLPLAVLLWTVTSLAAVIVAVTLTALPVATCVAMLRYRLYDVDVVINRTLVYGTLTLLLGAAFAATAVLLGTVLGRGSPWATAGATLIVAASFLPLRRRVQDAVDRRFSRARYDALHRVTAFLERLRMGEVEPEAIEGVLRQALCDPRLELWFSLPEGGPYVDIRGSPTADDPRDDRVRVPLELAGKPLGMVMHDPAAHEDPTLLRQVVQSAGLAVEIARLRVELRRQLHEVEASRARIVAAGNEERRRIERDLHDGAQQRLVSVALALRHAQHVLVAGAADDARRTLDDAVDQIAAAIDELRELARGLRPAQLDEGLAPALRELARRAPLPVEVRATSERFAEGTETAAYFIACEALTNAVKHARASKVVLGAARVNGSLLVSVADDGVGGAVPSEGSGLAGMADRVAAAGGTLRIDSRRGRGTTLTAELPCGS